MEKVSTFDVPHAVEYTRVRQSAIAEFVRALRERLELSSALDLGCGVGYFSKSLTELGFRVLAVDGREENTVEAKRRHPGINFLTFDAEELSSKDVGTFDFVLCAGLLYHLENPFRALRNLYGLTGRVLLLESTVVPGDTPVLHLTEELQTENQGLNYISFHATESCMVKLLYKSGFPFVYGFKKLPDYFLFQETPARHRERTMLVAAKQPLALPELEQLREPNCFFAFWLPKDRRPWWSPVRVANFVRWFISTVRSPGRTV